jgi:glycerol-3-phosphate dehydrogenase
MPDFNVCVIGGGVVGCAIARELSHYKLSVALVEAANDVGTGTSKANTAILHTGFDTTPGSLESKLLARGYERMEAYAADTDIPVERTGALLVAWNHEQGDRLPLIIETAHENGVHDLEVLTDQQVYDREPNLGRGVTAGVLVPGESIICPFTPVLAYVTEAIENGLELFLENKVTAIEIEADCSTVVTNRQRIRARWVINAAGLYADAIDAMIGTPAFSVTPRRGQLIVFDRLARSLISHIILPIPTERTKGVLVSPTVFGNILLGPTAEDLEDKRATVTTRAGLDGLLQQGGAIVPLTCPHLCIHIQS